MNAKKLLTALLALTVVLGGIAGATSAKEKVGSGITAMGAGANDFGN